MNDLISRKALIREIGRTDEWYKGRSICNIIDNAPTVEQPTGEWIPVSERLPERYKEVIVTDIETSGTYQSRYLGNGYWEYDNGTTKKLIYSNRKSLKNRIIAWMPLPEPYKKGGEET